MGYYFLVIGSIISAFALWAMFAHLKLLLMGVRTQGVIVDIHEKMRYSGGSRKLTYFHPVIEFETIDGTPFRFTYGGASTRKRPVVGDHVTVVYDVDRPDAATLHSFMGIWAGPLAAALLGAGAIYAGVQMVFYGIH